MTADKNKEIKMQRNSVNRDPGEKSDSLGKDSATQKNPISEAMSVICDELVSSHDLRAIAPTD